MDGKIKNTFKTRKKPPKEIKEIFERYFELASNPILTGSAIYKGRVPALKREICFNENDCLEIIKNVDEILGEVVADYFIPSGKGYMDPMGHVYKNNKEAFEKGFIEGLYFKKTGKNDMNAVNING
jgi:hypothetical protein